jgi:uncharacterized protein (UPF0548 family)
MPAARLDPDVEAQLRAAELTYDHVGCTSGALPTGYHHLTRRLALGRGTTLLADAARSLFSWQMHLRSGLRVSTSSPTVESDAIVVLGIGAGPLRISAPCRVVYLINEPNQRGFAYGTLPGHPESGEEAFLIERADDDTVSFSITAFSRPASALTRLAGPLGRLTQRKITSSYLRSLLPDATEHHR